MSALRFWVVTAITTVLSGLVGAQEQAPAPAAQTLSVEPAPAPPMLAIDPAPSASSSIEDPVDTLALNPLAALNKAALDGFRDAPLFTPSRTRPAPPPEPVAEVAPPPPPPAEEAPPVPPKVKLSGVVQGPEGAVAFVAKEGDEAVEQLRLGDQVDGWLVTTIDPAALKLTLGEREQDYRLFVRPDHDPSAADGEDASEKSSNDDAGSDQSAEDADGSAHGPNKGHKSGAQNEMEAAQKAQRDSRRRQRLRPENAPPVQQPPHPPPPQ